MVRALNDVGLLVVLRTNSESAAEYLKSSLEPCDAIVADIQLFCPMLRATFDSTLNRIRLVLLVQKGFRGIDWNLLPQEALLLPKPLQVEELMMLLS